MAYFAHINDTNTVTQVISISNAVLGEPDNAFPDTEPLGQEFISNVLGLSGVWLQTSFNNRFRANFAGVSYSYDAENDVFIAPQPYPSWSLDENYNWVAPVPCPSEGLWYWDETEGEWVEAVAGS